ncbi:MAG: sulfatase [Acidimicrobiia bacterium]|nr:sulfatase [Acidimicrobiia bacterium]
MAPNLLFVMSDDHASHAISAYGSRINRTPNIDRIAREGMRFDACFCTNSICTPSRAAVLTGTYNHVNGVTTLDTPIDASLPTYVSALGEAGYQTAIFGKWHLGHGRGHDPVMFDEWAVLPDQGEYHDPVFLTAAGEVRVDGYATDVITDMALEWLDRRDPDRPFALMVHHKAPHRPWEPDAAHADLYEDEEIPEPHTFWDDHATRSAAAAAVRMQMMDLTAEDLKQPVPEGLSADDEIRWRYQRYIKDYLRVVASIDDNVGRLLDRLDRDGLADDTVVVYTSDQGFFLGDHGWFDKRFIYEESLAMPLLVRYPREVVPGTATDAMVLNVDFAPTFVDLAGLDVPAAMQGVSIRSVLRGAVPDDWRTSMYYRYWMHRDDAHLVPAHYGVRTHRHKLIYFYNDPMEQPGARPPADPPEWELYDLVEDPFEIHNVIDDPTYAAVRDDLRRELRRLQQAVGDEPHPSEGPLP